jgi:hypothetical protein
MDRLGHIGVVDYIATVKECHHHRNSLDLTPGAHAKPLYRAARQAGRLIRARGQLRQGNAYRRGALASRKRREVATREFSQRRARSCKPDTQRESITNRCRE